MWIGLVLVMVAALVAVGVGAYNLGFTNGAETEGGVEVVRVYGHGGFGFGFLLFPLFLIGLFLLFKGAAHRRWSHHGYGPGDGGGYGPGRGWGGPPPAAEEWHRRWHEEHAGGQGPAEGGGSTTTGSGPGTA
jgi:hypothetical protein